MAELFRRDQARIAMNARTARLAARRNATRERRAQVAAEVMDRRGDAMTRLGDQLDRVADVRSEDLVRVAGEIRTMQVMMRRLAAQLQQKRREYAGKLMALRRIKLRERQLGLASTRAERMEQRAAAISALSGMSLESQRQRYAANSRLRPRRF